MGSLIFLTLSSIPARGRGPQIAAFVYESGALRLRPFAALDASSSHRCGNASYRAFCSQSGQIWLWANEAPSVHKRTRTWARQAPESGCTHHTTLHVSLDHQFLLLVILTPAPEQANRIKFCSVDSESIYGICRRPLDAEAPVPRRLISLRKETRDGFDVAWGKKTRGSAGRRSSLSAATTAPQVAQRRPREGGRRPEPAESAAEGPRRC